ncbi:hypothetical protein LXL04_001805 [Taraxacum kok-saghyz]
MPGGRQAVIQVGTVGGRNKLAYWSRRVGGISARRRKTAGERVRSLVGDLPSRRRLYHRVGRLAGGTVESQGEMAEAFESRRKWHLRASREIAGRGRGRF